MLSQANVISLDVFLVDASDHPLSSARVHGIRAVLRGAGALPEDEGVLRVETDDGGDARVHDVAHPAGGLAGVAFVVSAASPDLSQLLLDISSRSSLLIVPAATPLTTAVARGVDRAFADADTVQAWPAPRVLETPAALLHLLATATVIAPEFEDIAQLKAWFGLTDHRAAR